MNWEELERIDDTYGGFLFMDVKLNMEVTQNFITQKC